MFPNLNRSIINESQLVLFRRFRCVLKHLKTNETVKDVFPPEDVLLHDPLPVEGHLAGGAAEVLDVAMFQRFQMSLTRKRKHFRF